MAFLLVAGSALFHLWYGGLLELSPQDQHLIHEFADAVRDFTRMELPVDMTPSDPLELLQMGQSMLPVLLPTLRWRSVTVRSPSCTALSRSCDPRNACFDMSAE